MPRPRGRPRRTPVTVVHNNEDEETETEDEDVESIFSVTNLVLEDVELVSHFRTTLPFLADAYFDMCKELKKELTCGVCLDELNCKHCFMTTHKFMSKF